ncbi:hypothetical protein G5V59_20400 [Nocardioides sp. W3-2-3]|uniref:hypothetical protein n=1 Tax=Nocardioides convexus TaxID=2712224 RepID=UPI002418ACB5|nr:hypothetical protein [Nocardioides convexus]NHA01399.1 hypothetical protein [Nocardioides convexus]
MSAPEDPPPTRPLQTLEVGGGKGLRIAIGVLGALVLAAVVVVGLVVVLGRGDEPEKDTGAGAPSSTTTSTTAAPPSSLDIPTINPSDFPTEPADGACRASLRSRLPSGLPSNFASSLPSQFPTDPEGWQSWATDFLEQMNP